MPRTVGRTEDLVYSTVVELFRGDREWRMFFRNCCEDSPERLRSQTRQLRDELEMRGEQFKVEEIEDVLLALAREKLPDSSAAQWDAEHASRLCKGALARLGEYYAGLCEDERERLNVEAQDEWHDRMNEAGEENEPAAFRLALAGWERAGVEAFEEARSRKPVAS